MMWMFVSAALAADLPLEAALQRAVDTSEDVRAAAAGVDGAAADQRVAVSSWLPQASGSASYSHTFASEYDDLFSDSTGGASPFSDLPFGQADTWRLGLSLSQGVYQGGRVLAQRRLASAGAALADSSLDSARASTVLSAAEAYYDALLARRVLEISEATLVRAETTLREAKLANEVGRLADFDVLRASVEAENQKVAVIQQKRMARLAEANLRRILHVPEGEPLELSTGLDDGAPESVAEVAAQIAGVDAASASRAAVLQAELARDSAAASVSLTRASALPYFALSASYGLVQYPDGLVPDADWRKNVSAGASLSVPLFSGGAVRGQIASAQADLRAAEQRLEQARSVAQLDADDNDAALEAAAAQWAATAGTVAQAEKALNIAETRFQEGISTQSELADARLLHQQALINRANAARDLQVARIRHALLPALPLAGGSTASY